MNRQGRGPNTKGNGGFDAFGGDPDTDRGGFNSTGSLLLGGLGGGNSGMDRQAASL